MRAKQNQPLSLGLGGWLMLELWLMSDEVLVVVATRGNGCSPECTAY